VNDSNYQKSFLGLPQGGIISPLLSNLYLHQFDIFMNHLIEKYSTFDKRVSKHNPLYSQLKKKIAKLSQIPNKNKEVREELAQLNAQFMKTPSMMRDSTTGTRVYYNRYADD